jgi:hypothetical protein
MVVSFCPQAAVLAEAPRQCNTLPDVIFSNAMSLPWGDRSYRAQWTTPHVFFISNGDTDLEEWGGRMPLQPPPLHPPGWSSRLVSLSHCEAGGGTTGRWSIMAWYPPSYPAVDLASLAPQPWFPIRAFINDQVAATPVPVANIPGDLPPTPSVVRWGGKTRVRGASPGGGGPSMGPFSCL